MRQSVRKVIYKNVDRLQRLIRLVLRDVRANVLGQTFPAAPITLKLLVNNICNSRCQMCHIWQQKQGDEFTPGDLAKILADPLFRQVKYVTVSGGEPTLRHDLPQIYEVLAQNLPAIEHTDLITNAIQTGDVIARAEAAASVVRSADVSFELVVSLDGVGDMHDTMRGHRGNFASAVEVIRHFRDQTDIPVSINCTITKENAWHVDAVLDFCRSERTTGQFRIAEFSDRLYNTGQREVIRNFTDHEAYHLGLFFAKLELTYEKSPSIKRTYRSIRQMLIEGCPRSVRCPWQSTAVTLDSRGRLLYCAPRSPVLGDCLDTPAHDLYTRHVDVRQQIVANDCAGCIQDYHAEETLTEWIAERKQSYWRHRLSLDNALKAASKTPYRMSAPLARAAHILVIGWYGTETAGDKAILGNVLHTIRQRYPEAKISLASLYHYLTVQTLLELEYSDVEIVPVYSSRFGALAAAADVTVLGGGPLMNLEVLGFVLWAFARTKRAGHRTSVAGCGIGPLTPGSRYEAAVRHILRLADQIELRDQASVARAVELCGRSDVHHTGDPATGFVKRWMAQNTPSASKPHLNLYLREWPLDYREALTEAAFYHKRAQFEEQLGKWVRHLSEVSGCQPRLLPMHHFCVGGDDREFNRWFAQQYLADLDVFVEQRPLSVQAILASMQSARICICMRFHSVLFADVLGVPFLAIDYTQGGKIYNYLSERNKLDRMLSIQHIGEGKWRDLNGIL